MSKPRSIFEEVATRPADPAAAPRVPARRDDRRGLAIWLGVLFALVVAMIVVGGLTRLTGSGLSITEWRPVTGMIPPMDAASWAAEFEKYRATPQYELTNAGMELAEFKFIYWWEWGHRQLGRLIGLVWGVGFLWFWLRGRLTAGWVPRLLGLGALGGLQGAIGWWMVSSGLTGEMIRVASYRLAVHLGLAFAILGLIAWYLMRAARTEADLLQARRQRNAGMMRWGTVLIVVAFAQILLGALVAGIDAGRGYIDWPLMGGEVFPSGAFAFQPTWTNFLENPALVQFNHRLLGYVLVILGIVSWVRARASALGDIRRAFMGVSHALLVQLALGVATLLTGVPWQIAILHQLMAVALFVLIIRARFIAQYPRPQRIARG